VKCLIGVCFLLLLSIKEHGILARREKNSHILARADNESCTENIGSFRVHTWKARVRFQSANQEDLVQMTPGSYQEEHIDRCFLFLALSVTANSSDN